MRRMRGTTRSVHALADRMEVVASLEMVNGVTSFAEDTQAKLIARVDSCLLVKSEDWKDKGVVGREWIEVRGGKPLVLRLTPAQ